MGVGANLEAGAMLPLVHIGVHVANDGVLNIALGIGELGNWTDVLHLVNSRGQRNGCARHGRDLGAPATTGNHNGVGLDRALVGNDGTDPAIGYFDVEHLGVRGYGEGIECHRLFTHDGASAK